MNIESKDLINKSGLTKEENSDLPRIFTGKVNDSSKLRPLANIVNSLGETRHFPASTKEWFNSIYSYNSTYAKNLPSADKNLSKIIKSYFNLYFNRKFMNSKKIATRFRRLSFNKIFVSKAEIRHTSEKVNITLYIYNEEKRLLIRKIKRLEKSLYPKTWKLVSLGDKLITAEKVGNKLSYIVLNEILPNLWLLNNIIKLLPKLSDKSNQPITLSILNKVEDDNKEVLLKNMSEDKLLSLINIINKLRSVPSTPYTLYSLGFSLTLVDTINKLSGNLFPIIDMLNKLPNKDNKIIEEKTRLLVRKIILEKEIALIVHYKRLLDLNNSKFEVDFLSKIKPLVMNLYNKEVEFNIVNLKTLCFNSDMFTEAITVKLRNRDNRLLRVLRSSLHMVKLPKINKIREKYGKSNKGVLWLNSVKNLRVDSPTYIKNLNKDFLSQFIFDLLSSKSPLNIQDKETLIPSSTPKQDNSIENIVLSSLKHKIMAGARLEVKGRLTRRFTASRAVFKVRWKGGLKNIDSSYKGLSSVILRGHAKSNVQYSMFSSKTRNGAFGLKGWISSK